MSNPLEALLIAMDGALRTLTGGARAARPSPAVAAQTANLSPEERALSGALMRVNHVGEVCAQALYQAQALTARSPTLKKQMAQAAEEELDHLAWTERRLVELGDRRSLLNPLWYAGSFAIGLLAGRSGEGVSLGFVMETERQVEQHLASHLDRLPVNDWASRAIVKQMKEDEASHADLARDAGAVALKAPVRGLMRAAARIMTTTAHRL